MKLELLELASSGAESDPHKFGRVLAGVVQESLREARAPGGMAEAVSETQMQACASCLSQNKPRDIWTGDAGHHGHLRQLAFSSRARGQNLLECTSAVSFVKRCSLQDDCDARLEDLEKQLEQLMEEELVLESETQPAVELQGQGGERQLREAKQQEEERKRKEADEEAQRMKERLEAERLALHKKEEEAKKKQERQEAERLALLKQEEEAKKKQERQEAERLALLKQEEEAKKKQERQEAERLALLKQQEEAKKKQEREEAERLALLKQQEEAKKKLEAEEEKERLRREEAIKEQERDDMEWLANQERKEDEEEERKKGAEAEAEQDLRAASESPMKMAQNLQAPRDDDCAGQMEEMKAAVESARQEARRKEEELLQMKAKLASKGAPTTASAERKQLLQQLQQKREALLKQQLEARKARADRATAAKAPPAKARENQQEAFAAELAKAFGWGTAATETEEKPVPAADLQATSVQQQQPKAQLQEADAPAWIHPELPSGGDVEQTKAAVRGLQPPIWGQSPEASAGQSQPLEQVADRLANNDEGSEQEIGCDLALCDHRGNLEQVNLMFQLRSKQATKNKQQAKMTPLTELEVKQKYGEQAERVMQQKRTQGLVVEDPNLQGVSLTSIFVHVCPSFIDV